jgi:hypothetical protein
MRTGRSVMYELEDGYEAINALVMHRRHVADFV